MKKPEENTGDVFQLPADNQPTDEDWILRDRHSYPPLADGLASLYSDDDPSDSLSAEELEKLNIEREKCDKAVKKLSAGVLDIEGITFLKWHYRGEFPFNKEDFVATLSHSKSCRTFSERNKIEALILGFSVPFLHNIEKRGGGCTKEEGELLRDAFNILGGWGNYPDALYERLILLEEVAESDSMRSRIDKALRRGKVKNGILILSKTPREETEPPDPKDVA